MLNNITDIKHVVYINLETRKDRKEQVEEELKKININNAERYNAVKTSNNVYNSGAIGCALSHLKCLLKAKECQWEHVMIVEDDIEFLDPELFLNNLNTFLSITKNNWDVVLLAGNNMLPYIRAGNCSIKVMNCITTTGYIVLNKYYNKLIENYKNGIEGLLKNPNEISIYAIDKYWLKLQRIDDWFLIVPTSVIQRKGYSDIQDKVTDFKTYMIDYNKVQYLH